MGSQTSFVLEGRKRVIHRWPNYIRDNDISDYRDELEYYTNDVYLKKYSNAWVSPESVIYKNFNLIEETMASPDFRSYYRFRHLIKKRFFGKRRILNDQRAYLLATDNWTAGHFHWFCETLPKLYCIRDYARNFCLLLPDHPYVRNIGTESLRLLNFEFADIVWMKQDEFYKIKNLHYINNPAPSGKMNKELLSGVSNELRSKFPGGNRKVYISRSKARFRKILNEEKLISHIRNQGFDIIHAEDYSFSEQAQIFSETRILLGMHGSGLTNVIFMKPGAKLLEIRKKENGPFNVGYWHLADSVDVEYHYYNAIPDSNRRLAGEGCNLTVDIDELDKKLEEAGKS